MSRRFSHCFHTGGQAIDVGDGDGDGENADWWHWLGFYYVPNAFISGFYTVT